MTLPLTLVGKERTVGGEKKKDKHGAFFFSVVFFFPIVIVARIVRILSSHSILALSVEGDILEMKLQVRRGSNVVHSPSSPLFGYVI